MGDKAQRVFLVAIAVVFIGTSSVATIAVIVGAIQNSKNNKTTAETNKETPVQNDANKLQGTQLANYTPIASIEKLEAIDTTPGTGEAVKAGEKVSVDYTGAVAATGVIFQSSKDTGQQVSFGLDQVIAGWSQGIPGMKVGGIRRLLIPATLAYGSNPPAGSGIPTNADLVFDVTLYSVGK